MLMLCCYFVLRDNVSTISFHQRNAINGSADIEAANNTSGGEDVPPSHPHKASLSIKSENKHLSTASKNNYFFCFVLFILESHFDQFRLNGVHKRF